MGLSCHAKFPSTRFSFCVIYNFFYKRGELMKSHSWITSFIFVASLLTPNLNLFSEAGINAYVLSHGSGSNGFVGVFETDTPFAQTATIGSSFSNPTGMVYTVVPVVPPTVPPTNHELVYVA